jgi:tetratricopeptide (TPR) repeat protein
MQESIRIAKESFGQNNPSYATLVGNLGQLYYEMGQYEQAEPLMREAMWICRLN